VSEELEKLERLLERATAAGNAPEKNPDPETASLREAWIAFGRLLEAAKPSAETWLGSRPLRPPQRSYRRFWPAAGLLAASLLICAVAMWRLQATSRPENASPSPAPIASTGVTHSAPATKEQKPTASATGPQWDDSFDEQVAQFGRQVIDVQQSSYAWTDNGGAVQSKIEQIQKDFQDNSL
jgi:hypothetical protein